MMMHIILDIVVVLVLVLVVLVLLVLLVVTVFHPKGMKEGRHSSHFSFWILEQVLSRRHSCAFESRVHIFEKTAGA